MSGQRSNPPCSAEPSPAKPSQAGATASGAEIVHASLRIPPEQMLYCGMAIGYDDRGHPVNSFRTRRAEVSEFRKFFGFE
jgi:hypothetical protein